MEQSQYLTVNRVIRFMLICLILGILFSVVPAIKKAAGRQDRGILKAFDVWAKECIDTTVTSRKLIDTRRIADAGQYLDPRYIRAVKTLSAYQDVLSAAADTYEKRVWKLARESAMLNAVLAMADTITFTPDEIIDIECQKEKVRLLKTIQDRTVPAEVYGVIGMAVRNTEAEVTELARQDGELIEIHVRYKGEKKLSHNLVFAKPMEACNLVFVGEFKMPADGKKSMLDD